MASNLKQKRPKGLTIAEKKAAIIANSPTNTFVEVSHGDIIALDPSRLPLKAVPNAKAGDAAVLNVMAVEERRKYVSHLYAQRLTQQEIADRLGVCKATICGDLAALREQWLIESNRDVKEVVARELGELNYLEELAYSIATDERIATATRLLAMEKVTKFKEMRARYMSLFAPTKTETTIIDGEDVRRKLMDRLSAIAASRGVGGSNGGADG